MLECCVVLGSDDGKSMFELGMWKACTDNDVRICDIAGAAFGAINAALFAQGDFEKAVRLWTRASESKIFSDFYSLRRKYSESLATPDNRQVLALIKRIAKGNEPVLIELDGLLRSHIDEEKVRQSNIGVHIPIVSVKNYQAMALGLDTIRPGQLVNIIKFSLLSYLFFSINSSDYDMNILDNAAYKAVSGKNAQSILTPYLYNAEKLIENYPDENFIIVENSEYLGLSYTHTFESLKRNIQLGLLDTLKAMEILKGKEYYIDLSASSNLYEWFKGHLCTPFLEDIDEKIGRMIGVHNTEIQANMLKGMELLSQTGRYRNSDVYLSALETSAAMLYIERAKRYSPDALINEIIISANNIIQKNLAAIQDEENILKAMGNRKELPSFTDESSPAINLIYFLCAPRDSNIFMNFIESMKPEMKVVIITLVYLLVY